MLHQALTSLLSLLFPERCAGCRALGATFCARCRGALECYPDDGRCPPEHLRSIWVAYVFEGPLREAVHQLKYRARRRVAAPLGALLADRLATSVPAACAVVPIPLHPERMEARGYNQAEELARAFARATSLPLRTEGIVRVRATEQQARLNARQRRENTRDAFAWRGAAPPPDRVLLLDDVLTTGATMSACAAALLAAGAREVYGVALARSRLE